MATAPITSPLPDDAKQIVGTVLQDSLADYVDLSLTAKQWHWNVVGTNFREAHLHLDELVDLARTYSDEVAERAAALGVSPDGRAETVAKSSGLPTTDEGWRKVEDVNAAVVETLAALVARLRERIAVTDEPDPVTQDLLIGQTAKIEEAHWMWQAKTA
ncbi:DNA starvation/stationary phase protection protein [Actinomycetospora sp. NBRC 106375]|uniref:Dps family protein n=1 Tax=Actinomycetospora sp. NBRC 106375 TaxID=3032207 RepID=UPI0024A56272|nr:DNA starvation/stationary phase protection protein [Actinomycetospora sp. NBRC 106375]GLZ49309.1 DNA starvation/stationary phase protection protein [Actinomycetospora sp. NBRC 106375]